jgi:ATP-dependent Lon protease
VRSDVAMTGEITLSGAVLPVGGIREKVLAARRYGITTFVLPERNAVDIPELPDEVRADMTFVPVRTIDEVLAVALPPSEAPPLPADLSPAAARPPEPAPDELGEPAAAAVREPGAPQP